MSDNFKVGDIVDYPSGKKYKGVIKKIICKLCESRYQCRCQNVLGVKITVEWELENGQRKRNRYQANELIPSSYIDEKKILPLLTEPVPRKEETFTIDKTGQQVAPVKYSVRDNPFIFNPNRVIEIICSEAAPRLGKNRANHSVGLPLTFLQDAPCATSKDEL